MKPNRILSALLACVFIFSPFCASRSMAAPAFPGPVTVTEPATGQSISIKNYGDEYFAYSTDTQGYLFMENGGRFYYVRENGGDYAIGAPVLGSDMNSTGELNADTRVKAGDAGLQNKLTALRKSLEKAEHSMEQSSGGGTSVPIPLDYDVNSDGSLDAAKGSVHHLSWNDFSNIQEPPTRSECPLLLLHVEFNDVNAAFDDAAWHSLVFEGGVNGFYTAASNDSFTYVTAAESSGTVNDGVITVCLPIDAPLWAQGESDNLSTNNGIMQGLHTGSDGKIYAIYNESSIFLYAMLAAKEYLGDLSAYDRNTDGYLSPSEMAFYVIFSGFDVSYSGNDACAGKPAAWAHHWVANDLRFRTSEKSSDDLLGSFAPFSVNGVKLCKYSIMGELQQGTMQDDGSWLGATQMQSGTLCHELGHDLGLMDLYNTLQGNLSKDVGSLSIMSGGSWGSTEGGAPGSMPTHIDPYDKEWLGFYGIDTASASGLYTLNAAEPPADYNILRVNTSDPNIYYLLENRRNVGFDRGLYYGFGSDFVSRQGGIVVWRVDKNAINLYWNSNRLNAHEDQYAIMPLFHNDDVSAPFWGGNYFVDGETLSLPQSAKLRFTSAAGGAMQVYIEYPQDASYSSSAGSGSGNTTTLYSFKNAIMPNASGGLTATVDADCEKLTGVQVDGRTLEKSEYELKCGSTIITLKEDFVRKLSKGEHILRVQFTDGSASTAFSTDAPSAMQTEEDLRVPATGGTPLAWALVVAATGLCLIVKRRTKA